MSDHTTAPAAEYTDIDAVPGSALDGFPPNLDTDSEGAAFIMRLAVVGAGLGLLGGLVTLTLGWWVAAAVFVLWVIGTIVAGLAGARTAKKHRAGVGYPSDPAAWLSSFAFTVPAIGAAIGAISIIIAISAAVFTAAEDSSPNYTPAILLAIVTVLAVGGLRWITYAQPRWLIYGER